MSKQNGYYGGIVTNVPNIELQKSNNFDVSFNPNLYKQGGLLNDVATITLDTQQSIGVGAYQLDNMYGGECELKNAREIQVSQPAINFNGGKGWMGERGCLIDNDSNLRLSETTNMRFINQLPSLHNAGFYGKGEHKVDDESIIQSANITSVDRPCNVLSGVSIKNILPEEFPMIDRLKSEVQDPKHLIPEDSMQSWVRGGLPSRQISRNVDYIQRCENLRNNSIPMKN